MNSGKNCQLSDTGWNKTKANEQVNRKTNKQISKQESKQASKQEERKTNKPKLSVSLGLTATANDRMTRNSNVITTAKQNKQAGPSFKSLQSQGQGHPNEHE